MITNDQRYEIFTKSSDAIKNLYDSFETGKVLKEIFEKNTIDSQIGIGIVGDTILGFSRISEMPRLFKEQLSLSDEQSQRITSELIEVLAPVVELEKAEGGTKKEDLAALAATFAQPQPERLENPDVDIFTSNVEPLRTMEGDINRIHGYGVVSEQAESAEDQAVEDEQPITPKTDTATLSSE